MPKQRKDWTQTWPVYLAFAGLIAVFIWGYISHRDATNPTAMQIATRAKIATVGPDGVPQDGKECRINMVYRNSGLTDAKVLMAKIFADFRPATAAHPTFDAEHFVGHIPLTLVPGIETSQTEIPLDGTAVRTTTFPQSVVMENLRRGTQKLYLYGAANYADVYGFKHWLSFCYMLEPDLQTWHLCAPDGYKTDDIQE